MFFNNSDDSVPPPLPPHANVEYRPPVPPHRNIGVTANINGASGSQQQQQQQQRVGFY